MSKDLAGLCDGWGAPVTLILAVKLLCTTFFSAPCALSRLRPQADITANKTALLKQFFLNSTVPGAPSKQ